MMPYSISRCSCNLIFGISGRMVGSAKKKESITSSLKGSGGIMQQELSNYKANAKFEYSNIDIVNSPPK